MTEHDVNTEHHDDHDDHEDHEDHDHMPTFIKVFVGLLICTVISTAVGFMISWGWFDGNELSGWGIMLTVSCVKAFLVITFFMHLKWEVGTWKWVLTIPASIMSLFLIVMLVPDVGMRTNHYTHERTDRAAYDIPEDDASLSETTGHLESAEGDEHSEGEATH
tara:strand:+ start:2130 stop:2618 length:489 start_codon:yes stop_codon:yes gene_type:complete